MPVIIQDTAVVSQGFCAPISSPASPVLAPAEINTQAASQIASARFISTEEAAAIAAPVVIDFTPVSEPVAPFIVPAVSASAIGLPDSIDSVPSSSASAPIVITPSAASDVSAPLLLSFVAASAMVAPFNIDSVSASSVAAPIVLLTVAASDVAAPIVLPFIAATPVAAPNVITPNAYSDQPPFPLTHPRILYENKLIGSTVSAGGSGAINTLNPATYSRWSGVIMPASSAIITYTLPTATNLDSLAIGAHNLGSMGVQQTIRCEYALTIGGDWIEFATLQTRSGGDNSAIMFIRATPVAAAQIRVRLTSATGPYYVGVIYAGIALQMQRAIYGGVNPITLNRVTDYFSNKSEAGEWLGRQVRRRGLESSLSFDRLTAPWYRQYFDSFVVSAITSPFFFAWRPADYPAEVAYCWTESDIQPSNSGGATNHMSVQFSVKAHA